MFQIAIYHIQQLNTMEIKLHNQTQQPEFGIFKNNPEGSFGPCINTLIAMTSHKENALNTLFASKPNF